MATLVAIFFVTTAITGLVGLHFAQPRSGSAGGRGGRSVVGVESLPAGFSDSVVFSGLTNPTAVRFAADGRVFVAEKRGVIQVFDNLSDTSPTTFADFRTNAYNFWDRGLLGLALAPTFPTDPWVYALYTYDADIGGTAPKWGSAGADSDPCPTPPGATTDGCVVSGRLSRFEANGNSAGPEQVLINDWCQQFPSHSIGSLAFGPDGMLYSSAGDGASFNYVDYGQAGNPKNPCGDPPGGVGGTQTPPTAEGGALRSQDNQTTSDPTTLDGAILRLDPATGAAAPGNPNTGDANAQRIVAYGLRNPFRFTIRPGTSEVWVADVGWDTWEEIDRILSSANLPIENFGWPCYEGTGRQPGYDGANLDICENLYAAGAGAVNPPYYTYAHSAKVVPGESCPTGGSSTTGLAFYTGGSYPSTYNGSLFFADYSRNCIWAMLAGSNGLPDPNNIVTFVAPAAAPVELQIGPGGDLFYVDFNGGTIRRITFAGPPPPGTIPVNAFRGEYYDNADLTNRLLVRTDATINFDWGLGSPDPSIGPDTFSVRWEGYWDFPVSGRYRFTMTTDDGMRVWADNVSVLDSWILQPATTYLADVRFSAGRHDIRVEFFDNTDEAVAKVSWAQAPNILGKDTIGALIRNAPNGLKWGSKFSLADQGTFSKVSAYLDGLGSGSGSQSFRALIYADSSGSPGALRATSGQVAVPHGQSARWVDFPISPGVALPAGTYWVVLHGGPTGNSARRYGDAVTGAERYNSDSFSNGATDPFGTASTGNWIWSIYATYVTNAPPVATIATPVAGTTWKVGDTVSFSGSATDPEDGTLPASALSWDIVLHHCAPDDPNSCHTHLIQSFPGTAQGSFAAPDHEYPSYLEVRLTARDSGGQTDVKSVRIDPQTTTFQFTADPSGVGLQLVLGSTAGTAPFTRTVIVGSTNSMSAPSPQTIGGTTYTWASWSDGGAQTHNVVAGSSPSTYTATFTSSGGNSGFPTIQSVTSTSFPTDSTTHNVQMPATVNAGDLLIVFFADHGTPGMNYPSGWTFFFGWSSWGGTGNKFWMFAKRASGTEGGTTVNFQTSAAVKAAAQVYRITGWRDSGTITNDIEYANAGAASTSPNPSSLNPTHWDVENTLWIASYGADGDNDATAFPANYAGGTYTESDHSATSTSMGSAWRNLAAASEDPGSFTIAASAFWIASIVAVRPAPP